MENRLTYLKVRQVFKTGTENLKLDYTNGTKGITDVIESIKKGSTRYKDIMIDSQQNKNKTMGDNKGKMEH